MTVESPLAASLAQASPPLELAQATGIDLVYGALTWRLADPVNDANETIAWLFTGFKVTKRVTCTQSAGTSVRRSQTRYT